MKEKLDIDVAGGGGTISIICIEVKDADLGLLLLAVGAVSNAALLLEVDMVGCCWVKQTTLCRFLDNGDDFQKLNLCFSCGFPEFSLPLFPGLASIVTFW